MDHLLSGSVQVVAVDDSLTEAPNPHLHRLVAMATLFPCGELSLG